MGEPEKEATNIQYFSGVKIVNLFLKVIPNSYRENPSVLTSFFFWLLVGLLLRVLFMPFAFHGDLLSTYHRSYLLVFEGALGYLNPHELLQAAGLLFFSHATPIQEFLVWNGSTSVAVPFWFGVLENVYIFRTVFLLKLPYLITDILICVLLLHIFKKEVENGLRAFKFWILNPIIIFAVYIFGRYEVIPIFFILFCVYFLKEHHSYLAALSLGIAILSRYYALLFLPFILLIFCHTWMERIKFTIVVTIPLLTYNIFTKFFTDTLPTVDIGNSFGKYLLGMNFSIGYSQMLFIFVIAYSFILLYVYYQKKSDNPVIDFTAYSLIVLLLLYATSYFHPQYFAWFIPFLAIYWGYRKESSLIGLFCLQVILFMFYTFYWLQPLSTWMFASIDPNLFISLPSPLELQNLLYAGWTPMNIIRSILSAVLLFMAAKIILIERRGLC